MINFHASTTLLNFKIQNISINGFTNIYVLHRTYTGAWTTTRIKFGSAYKTPNLKKASWTPSFCFADATSHYHKQTLIFVTNNAFVYSAKIIIIKFGSRKIVRK